MFGLRIVTTQRVGKLPSNQIHRCLQFLREADSSKGQASDSKQQKVPLLEELFPERIQHSTSTKANAQVEGFRVPRVSILESGKSIVESRSGDGSSENQAIEVTKTASKQALRQTNLTFLVLHTASKSLIESDFRRIAPKGEHLDWTGPGDILDGAYLEESSKHKNVNALYSDTCARSEHTGASGRLLHFVSQPSLRSNVPKSCTSPTPIGEVTYANVH